MFSLSDNTITVTALKVSDNMHQGHEFIDMGLDLLDTSSIKNGHFEAFLHSAKEPLNLGSHFIDKVKTIAKLRHIAIGQASQYSISPCASKYATASKKTLLISINCRISGILD